MSSWENILPYFPAKELACRHCALIKLDLVFAAALVALRHAWSTPLNPTSISRCPTHNENVGGHPRSLHLTENPVHQTDGTAAIDIYWEDWPVETKLKFAQLAWSMDWSLGLSKTFIHIDARSFLPGLKLVQKIYHYDSWNSPFSDEEVKNEHS